MTDVTPIKIISFQQIRLDQKESVLNIGRDQYMMNIIIYSPNKQLKFLDHYLKQLQNKPQIFIVKCNKINNLGYAIKECSVGVKTIFITDQEINEELTQKLLEHQKLLNKKENLKICMYVKAVEAVQNSFFHTYGIEMVTVEQSLVKKYLQSEVTKIEEKIQKQSIASTIMEKDQQRMNIKLVEQQSPNRMRSEILYQSQKHEEKYFDNGVPGPGTYNLAEQKTKGVKFGTQQRSDIKQYIPRFKATDTEIKSENIFFAIEEGKQSNNNDRTLSSGQTTI